MYVIATTKSGDCYTLVAVPGANALQAFKGSEYVGGVVAVPPKAVKDFRRALTVDTDGSEFVCRNSAGAELLRTRRYSALPGQVLVNRQGDLSGIIVSVDPA